MKTVIVNKALRRCFVTTVAAIMAVTSIGATHYNVPETKKEKNVSETASVSEGVTSDDSTVNVKDPPVGSETSIADSTDSSAPDSVSADDSLEKENDSSLLDQSSVVDLEISKKIRYDISSFTNAATETNFEPVERNIHVEPEAYREKEDKAEEETTTSEDFVENFGEDEKKESYVPESCHSPYSNHLTKFKGISYFTDDKGIQHRESYYDLNMSGVVSIMRSNGFSEDEYPYWVDEIRGTKMLGPYIMIAANLSRHPRGSIVDTDLGKAIVCDTGGFASSHTEGYDIATNWDRNRGAYPGYNC